VTEFSPRVNKHNPGLQIDSHQLFDHAAGKLFKTPRQETSLQNSEMKESMLRESLVFLEQQKARKHGQEEQKTLSIQNTVYRHI
jgi:hypothetical protein